MPDLLLELFSEEIPARMQRQAAADLQRLITNALVEAGLTYEGARAFATPRRLALTVHGLPARSPDQKEERKGPRVGAPEKAIEGFLKVASLSSIDQAKVQADKKGDFYLAVIDKPGRAAESVIAEIVPKVIRAFPWPKAMRWGPRSAAPGALVWVRPLHSILCVFGPETSETAVVEFEVDGIKSGNVTYGHRFMAPAPITVRRFDDYGPKLEAAKVVLDADRRKEIIRADAANLALAAGLELVEDEALLEEVAGLVEWPVVLMGEFEEAFLDIPPEVIRTTIRNNQKCFVLRKLQAAKDELSPLPSGERAASLVERSELGERGEGAQRPGEGGPTLANKFLLVANLEASDGGKAIAAGNGRVIRSRLSDARFFWETDLKPLPGYEDKGKPLDQRLAKLKALNVVFHEKLGTQGERVERIASLAGGLMSLVNFLPARSEGPYPRAVGEKDDDIRALRRDVLRAAELAKADLTAEMVGEFPELQGLMGRYYALAQGEEPSVAAAIEEHYKPQGPQDRVPTNPVSACVALADKIDLLTGFWGIDEKPTGSKDPYALRRAALGVIRIVLENGLRIHLREVCGSALLGHLIRVTRVGQEPRGPNIGLLAPMPDPMKDSPAFVAAFKDRTPLMDRTTADLLAFFADRLKVQLREQGARHDLVDAVFSLGQGATPPLPGGERAASLESDSELGERGEGAPPAQDDLLLIVRRVEALGKFLDTDDGKTLLAGVKRATNILRDEEKKSGEAFTGNVAGNLLSEAVEKALYQAVGAAESEARAAVAREDYAVAMSALAKLRAPVDAFFDKVRVNAEDPAVRANRLRLLNRIREATLTVADFSKIAG